MLELQGMLPALPDLGIAGGLCLDEVALHIVIGFQIRIEQGSRQDSGNSEVAK
jgi:hypothetical protein